jgi:hypothetical protein
MPLTPGDQYEIMFPSPLDEYFTTIFITDDESIPPDHFLLEMEVDNNALCFKIRIADTHTPCSYSLCSNGSYFLQTPSGTDEGECVPVPLGDIVKVTSDPISVDAVDQWVEFDNGTPVIKLYYTIIPDCSDVNIADPLQPETAFPHNGLDSAGNKYVAAFPADVVVPRGTGEKKVARKRVKIVWKKDL